MFILALYTLSFRLNSCFSCLAFTSLMFLQGTIVFPDSLCFTSLHRWHFLMSPWSAGFLFPLVPLSQVAGVPPGHSNPELLTELRGGPLVELLTLLCLHGKQHPPFGDYGCHFHQTAILYPACDQQGHLCLPSSHTISSWRAKVCVITTSKYKILHFVWFCSSSSFCSFDVSQIFVTSNFFFFFFFFLAQSYFLHYRFKMKLINKGSVLVTL